MAQKRLFENFRDNWQFSTWLSESKWVTKVGNTAHLWIPFHSTKRGLYVFVGIASKLRILSQ